MDFESNKFDINKGIDFGDYDPNSMFGEQLDYVKKKREIDHLEDTLK